MLPYFHDLYGNPDSDHFCDSLIWKHSEQFAEL